MSNFAEPMGAVASSSKASSAAPPSILEAGFSADIRLLRSIASSFHSTCRDGECKAPISVDDARGHIENWLAGAQRIPPTSQVSELTCGLCFTSTCAGCGFEPTLGQENIFTSSGVVNMCCSRGRLYGIWLLLSDFDEQEIEARQTKDRQKTPKTKKPKGSFPYASHAAGFIETSGVGYAGGWEYNDHAYRLSTSACAVNAEEEYPDAAATLILKLLTASIPSSGSSDAAPLVDELLCLFRCSLFMDRVAGLVRNDSIADLTERRGLYYALFAFIEAIADHPSLQTLLYEQRLNLKNTPGLLALGTTEDPDHIKIDTQPEDRLPSIFSYSQNIYKQSIAFTKMLGKAPEGFLDHSKESTRMCKTVIRVYGRMREEQLSETNTESNIGDPQSWNKFCDDHRVIFTDDVLIQHRFLSQSTSLKASNQKGRLSAIGKEIANMTTSLPPGIFLKVAESRSDVMKALIVGVEGTPYAGGLFSFDIFLDGNYPNSPPKLAFVLDGNDTEDWSFNPNLHKGTGTVCLSIINTWQGSPSEMWQPGKTTILAVLISIQAMILGAAIPWINEPGYIGQAASQAAADHKLLIQYKTVRYAMIGWLAAPRPENVVWDDISKIYWKYNGPSIMVVVKEWAKGNPRILTGSKDPRKKAKKKEPYPSFHVDLPVDNLAEKLSILLDLGTTLDLESAPEEESLTILSKSEGKATKASGAKTKGKGKRKASELSGDEDLDSDFNLHSLSNGDSDADPQTPKPKAGAVGGSKPKAAAVGGAKRTKRASVAKGETAKQVAKMAEPLWEYSGGKTQKETRQACQDFGISGAKSIKETIMKLEDYVNDNELWYDETAQIWGTLMGGFEY